MRYEVRERCVQVDGLAVTEMKTAECGLTEVVGPAASRLSLDWDHCSHGDLITRNINTTTLCHITTTPQHNIINISPCHITPPCHHITISHHYITI